jgi:hypothetical protein
MIGPRTTAGDGDQPEGDIVHNVSTPRRFRQESNPHRPRFMIMKG